MVLTFEEIKERTMVKHEALLIWQQEQLTSDLRESYGYSSFLARVVGH